jgi:hypothetical protein
LQLDTLDARIAVRGRNHAQRVVEGMSPQLDVRGIVAKECDIPRLIDWLQFQIEIDDMDRIDVDSLLDARGETPAVSMVAATAKKQ